MKKSLISLLLTGALFFSSPWNTENKDKQIELMNIEREIRTFTLRKENPIIKLEENTKLPALKEKDSIISKKINYIEIISNNANKRDEKYLYENTRGIDILNNEKMLKDSIIGLLKDITHTYREDNPVNEHYSQINKLSLRQNKVIYLIMGALTDSSFVNGIGKIINEDIKNIYSEIGGIVDFREKNKINLRRLESGASKDPSNDEYYSISLEAYLSKKIGYFHQHANEYDERKFAGPSSADIDLIELSFAISNLINEFIITSLKKGEFNMDYAGVDFRKDKKARTIDLGNYFYDTLKVK